MKPKKAKYVVTAEQMRDLDRIRQSLYMLSHEDLPGPVGEQIRAAGGSLYTWLKQFRDPIPVKEYAVRETERGREEWPDTHYELWEAHK